ncbi:hypothetical protein D0809_30805, partial [Flavobacterium circumlabens]
MIEVDNYFKFNNIILTKSINKSYDTPNLLTEKENLISQIRNENYFFSILSFLLLIGIVLAIYYAIKIKNRKIFFEQRFNELMEAPLLDNSS